VKKIFLIVIGKSKEEAFSKAEKEYLKRLQFINFNLIELKSLSSKEKNDQSIIDKINSLQCNSHKNITLLDEKGPSLSSAQFSKWIFSKLSESSPNTLIFIIGGAEGHGEKIKKFADNSLSLSQMTLPHRFARLIFIEQIYRSETIFQNHPYHK